MLQINAMIRSLHSLSTILVLLLLGFFSALSAQVSNLNINYEVQVDVIYINNNWNPVGNEQNTVIMDVYDIDWTGTHCFPFTHNGASTFYDSDANLHTKLNAPYFSELYFDLEGFGNVVGGACSYDIGDNAYEYQESWVDGYQDKYYLHEVGHVGQWSNDWSSASDNWMFNDGTYDVIFKSAWRYSGGDSYGNALDFGTMAANNSLKVHSNANRGIPSGATTIHIGYPANLFQSSSEVIYKFSLDQTSEIKITTNDPATNYDSYLHLLDANQNLITSNDDVQPGVNDKAEIIETLCAGTYYIVVEGYSGNEGDFTLYVEWLNNASMQVSLNATDATCPTSANGSVNLNLSGGVPPYQYSWQDGSTSANLSNVLPGAYSVFVTDGCGQTEFADIFVGISDNQAPTAVCRNLVYTLEPGQSVFFTANDIDDGSFDNCSIQELAIDIEQVNFDMVGDNFVTLTVYDDSGNQSSCTAMATVIQDVDDPNSVSDLATGIPFELAPNPALGTVFIQLDEQGLSPRAQFFIRDLTGRTIWSGPAQNGRTAIDLHTFAPGMYWVEVRDEQLSGTQRLVVQ